MINKDVKRKFILQSNDREIQQRLRDDMLEMSRAHKKKSFFFLFDTFQKDLKEEYNLTEYELGLLLILMAYQRFREYEETQSYIHYKGKRATTKDLEKILKLKRTAVNDFKRQMVQKNIIREDEHGMYLDENFSVRGKKTLNIEQYNRIYVNEVSKVYDIMVKDNMEVKEKKQAIKDVGLLFSLFPYMNKKTNVLVDDQFNNITMNELKSKLGLGKNHPLEERLGRINQRFYDATGQYLIYKLEPVGIKENRNNKKSFRLVMNPKLIFSSKVTNQSKIDVELFGDSETSTKDNQVNTSKYIFLLVSDNELFYMKTDFYYDITATLEKIQESNLLEFDNKKFETADIQHISLVEESEIENYIDEKYMKNEIKPLPKYDFNKNNFYKDLYLN